MPLVLYPSLQEGQISHCVDRNRGRRRFYRVDIEMVNESLRLNQLLHLEQVLSVAVSAGLEPQALQIQRVAELLPASVWRTAISLAEAAAAAALAGRLCCEYVSTAQLLLLF